ncbi:MAG TPA: family 43 glycosylhydrolase [Dinghuibacter sp.]|uniref:family 43 glycosylhydrolase n=1 Tax=Dinghuibacter sp. TaxID=2024697 RepID=UPI002BD96011|nr:family 43 glycosylhydrolase [Dinghuibacter sp.]HTJ11300.1 family 43 glycosylhydrolase [Dinghuibacter sp.]
MRKTVLLLLLAPAASTFASAQLSVHYDPSIQSTGNIDYFKPKGNLFVGDCIPFYHDGQYYLYWLLDSAHHKALGGLGGHQWALSVSSDLKTWKQYPVVLGIDEAWEKSICTGSVAYHAGKFYAFYATRLIDSSGKVNEQLSYAISDDGIHFAKQKPNPFYTSAPGYSKRNFRDPKVVVDPDGTFHLFVASGQENAPTPDDGALVHLVSKDLTQWSVRSPLIYGQSDVPECPDYFLWNGWYYLVYGRGGNTFYLKSRHPYGPWEYPRYQALNEDWVNVAKTAAFTGGRRIEAGWIPSRRDMRDDQGEVFGGNIVLRELSQESDGTLSTSFPKEVAEPTGPATRPHDQTIHAPDGQDAFFLYDVPTDAVIGFDAEASGPVESFGCFLRGGDKGRDAYRLAFTPDNREVSLAETHIDAVEGLHNKIHVQIVMKGDIIDVCIASKRCIVNRLYERKGAVLGFFVKHGTVRFSNIGIAAINH